MIFEHGLTPPPRLNIVQKNRTFFKGGLPLEGGGLGHHHHHHQDNDQPDLDLEGGGLAGRDLDLLCDSLTPPLQIFCLH